MLSKLFRSIIYIFAVLSLLALSPHSSNAQNTANELKKIEGTVSKVAPTSITVKSDKGDVTISLDQKTEITLNEKPATLADLKEGQQVTIMTDGTKAVSIKVALESA